MTSETLTGARVIRAFSRQKDEEKEFADNTEELKRQQIIAGRISALMNPATYVIVNFAIIAIIWFGGKTVYSGSISQGELIFCKLYEPDTLGTPCYGDTRYKYHQNAGFRYQNK